MKLELEHQNNNWNVLSSQNNSRLSDNNHRTAVLTTKNNNPSLRVHQL